MKLAYLAYEKSGRKVSSVIEAASVDEATEILSHQDMFVAEIHLATESNESEVGGKVRLPRSGTKRLSRLAMFTRQLYMLLHSGTPLTQGLAALERQAQDKAWRTIVLRIRMGVEGGASLSEAMAGQPEVFDGVYRNMVAAGETGGDLPAVLDRLSNLIKKRVHTQNAVKSALIYPCLLTFVAFSVMVVLLLFVIPRFGELFTSLDMPLPPSTRVLISLSEGFRSYWWALGVVVVGLAFLIRFGLRSPRGKHFMDTLVLRLPLIGGLVRSFATARIARMLGVLMDSGLPAVQVLQLSRGATSNDHYAALMKRAEEAVLRGEPISSAFRGSRLISPSVYEATRSGEETGQVSTMLIDMANFMDEDNEISIRSLTSIVEPVILILMGLLVACVALSIFVPLFDITGLVDGSAR